MERCGQAIIINYQSSAVARASAEARLLGDVASHPSQCLVHAVAASPLGSWLKVWHTALDNGVHGTCCSLTLLRLLSLSTFSDDRCPVPNCSDIIHDQSPSAHFLASHTSLSISVDQCVNALIDCSDDMFFFGHSLCLIFKTTWNS